MEFCVCVCVIYTKENGQVTRQCRSHVLLFIRTQPNTHTLSINISEEQNNNNGKKIEEEEKREEEESKSIHALHRRLIFIGFVRRLASRSCIAGGMPLSLLVVSRANENHNLLDIWLSEKRSFQLYIMFIMRCALWPSDRPTERASEKKTRKCVASLSRCCGTHAASFSPERVR